MHSKKLSSAGYSIEEDTVVPRAELPALIKLVKKLGKDFNFESVCFGHAGDGNLHIRIRKEGSPNSYGDEGMNKIIRILFTEVKKLGGTVSAEHGIGLIQKNFMDIVFQQKQLDLMRQIKKAFDPSNILNADKIF
jgi:glycolate oxidase